MTSGGASFERRQGEGRVNVLVPSCLDLADTIDIFFGSLARRLHASIFCRGKSCIMAAIALVLAALAAPLASASAAAADVETPMLRRGLKFGYGTGEAEVLPTVAPSASAEDGVSYAWSGYGESCTDACASIGASCSDSTYYDCGDDCADTGSGVADTCDFSWVVENYPFGPMAADSTCYMRSANDPSCQGVLVGIFPSYEEWSWAHASDTEYSCDATCDNMLLFCACV